MTTIHLPNEIILNVLSYLGYTQLKKCCRVCKGFKILIETHRPLCDVIFHSQTIIPAGTVVDLGKIKVHDAFDYVSYGCTSSVEDMNFFIHDLDDTMPFLQSSAVEEFATAPAVEKLRFRVHDFPMQTVKSKTGVTVLQVMKSLCRYLGKSVVLEHGECTRRDCMGDHTGWTGWDYVHQDGQGELLLIAHFFDS